MKISIVPAEEIARIRRNVSDSERLLPLLADVCRLNTLSIVKLAGSGHLGSSFSAMDIVVWLYNRRMNTIELGVEHPDRDIYFSSKGHDVPGLYAVLHSLGVIPEQRLLRLRRLGGLDGHPDVGVPGIECNSGSLGMGISKAKGMAWGKRFAGAGGHVYVLTGDGELQEGQNFEALQTAAHQRVDGFTVIVDHNKLQTDQPVDQITDLRNLEQKFAAFGWSVERCDGHDLTALEAAFDRLHQKPAPRVMIADTIKGRGVSFMEHPRALQDGAGFYRWHAGAPDDTSFEAAHSEIHERISAQVAALGLAAVQLRDVTPPDSTAGATAAREFVANAYGDALLDIGARHPQVIVLDGDLAADCRVRAFGERYPDRFIENGIAEQDMVSTAGGLARVGLLPVVNTFASFLASRANEQIYNNATEGTRIIYACHYAGLIPAGPGKSHQSVRDISLFGALPGCTILQPANAQEMTLALEYLVTQAPGIGVLRIAIGPSPRSIVFPADYQLRRGMGTVLTPGTDAILFAYGPVMLHEALSAAEILDGQGFGLQVVNMPWLNNIDRAWLAAALNGFSHVFVLEDHSVIGGLADRLTAAMASSGLMDSRRVRVLGVESFPACGTPPEALRVHGLDAASLARTIGGSMADAHVDLSVYTAEAPQ